MGCEQEYLLEFISGNRLDYYDFSSCRPNWEKCADVVAGGMDRWKELREGKTSDQLVDVLLNEISGGAGDEAGGAEYFDPQVMMECI